MRVRLPNHGQDFATLTLQDQYPVGRCAKDRPNRAQFASGAALRLVSERGSPAPTAAAITQWRPKALWTKLLLQKRPRSTRQQSASIRLCCEIHYPCGQIHMTRILQRDPLSPRSSGSLPPTCCGRRLQESSFGANNYMPASRARSSGAASQAAPPSASIPSASCAPTRTRSSNHVR